MKAMVFAAGLGSRLRPLTDTMPKALVPIQGVPLLEHVLLKIKQSGINQVVVNVHHFADQIIDFLAKNQNFGMDIYISDERDELLETGGGLRKACQYVGCDQPLLLHNVDILSNLSLVDFIQSHKSSDGATLVVSERDTSRYLLFDENFRMRAWQNTKTQEVKPAGCTIEHLQQFAFSGIQIISPEMLACLAEMPTRFSIIDFYLKMVERFSIRAYIPQDYRMIDVGKIDTLQAAESFLNTL